MKVSRFFVLVITFIVIANAGYAQRMPEVVWDKLYDSGYNDIPHSLLIDNLNKFIVVEGSSISDTNCEWLIAKYAYWDPSDNMIKLSDEYFENCEKHGFTLIHGDTNHPATYVFTGHSYNGSNFDFRTAGFDEDGNELWSNTYDGGNSEWATCVAPWDVDKILVGGNSDKGNGDVDISLLELDVEGNEIWHKEYDSGHKDYLEAMATYWAPGKVFLAGSSYNGSDFDITTRMLDADGNEMWAEFFDSGEDDFAYDVAASMPLMGKNNSSSVHNNVASNSMYIYVVGASSNGSNLDWQLLKYNEEGNLVWTQEYDSGKDDAPYRIAVDTAGYIYIAGRSFDEANNDFVIARYSPDGELIWDMVYDAEGVAAKSSADIEVDKKTGFIYVTFDYIPSSGYLAEGEADFRTIKYRQFLTVDGAIKENGSGMKDIMVVLSGSKSDTTYTNEDGNYTFSDLPCGEDYTITPHKEGYTFLPPEYTYSPLNSDKPAQDFAGTWGIEEEKTKVEEVDVSHEENRVVVKYSLNKSSRVDIKLLNSLGSVVDRVSGYERAGEHSYTFDMPVSGVYFVKINVNNRDEIRKVIITR